LRPIIASMDVHLQRILAALHFLFNPALVITLQRSVRKKRIAAQPRRDGRCFPCIAWDFFGLLDGHEKAYSSFRS